jgi:hypothetical protein
MFAAIDATDLSPRDDFSFGVPYYGFLLAVTAFFIVANVVFLTIVHSDASAWSRIKLAVWQTLLAVSGLGIGTGLPYSQHAPIRLGELMHRAGH